MNYKQILYDIKTQAESAINAFSGCVSNNNVSNNEEIKLNNIQKLNELMIKPVLYKQ